MLPAMLRTPLLGTPASPDHGKPWALALGGTWVSRARP
jgi:hypothetical protein